MYEISYSLPHDVIWGWLWLVGSIKIIGLFCKRALQKRRYSAKETYNFIDPTDRSHPIGNDYGVAKMHGYLKLLVFFRNRATDYRALLRKETTKEQASCTSSPAIFPKLEAKL